MVSSAIALVTRPHSCSILPLHMVQFRLETFQCIQHVLVETSVSVLGIANVAGAVVYKTDIDTQLRTRTRVNVMYQRRHDYQKV